MGTLFLRTEKNRVDVGGAIQSMVGPEQKLLLHFDPAEAQRLLPASALSGDGFQLDRLSMTVIYSYGGFTAATSAMRSGDAGEAPVAIDRQSSLPSSKVEAFFRNPFVDLNAARTAPLNIEHAYIGPVPDAVHGWLVALGLVRFRRILRTGPGRLRVARAVGADADAHPFQWHERCFGHQSDGLDDAGGNLFARSRQVWIFHDVFLVLRFHGDLPVNRSILFAGNKG